MSKKLILGLALAVVLFSGPLLSIAHRRIAVPASHQLAVMLVNCGQVVEKRDMDRSEATCQGAFNYGPTVPS